MALSHGDFGHPYQQDRDVLPLLLERSPAAAQLALGGLAVAVGIGVPLGVVAATRPRGRFDRLSSIITSTSCTPTSTRGSTTDG